MSAESTKAANRRRGTWLYNKVFTGKGIDIGCGLDLLKKEDFPNITEVQPFDLEHGDANKIDEYFPENTFNFVAGSQVLEHLWNPYDALKRFLKITKPGGYVVQSFPHFELYEKGCFEFRFNNDHKRAFSISEYNCHPLHVNVLDLVSHLTDIAEVIKIEKVDTCYDYSLPDHIDQTRLEFTEAFIEIILQKR
jgi:SAM-dependent methyltransferase